MGSITQDCDGKTIVKQISAITREEEMEEERKKAENMTSVRDKSISKFYTGERQSPSLALVEFVRDSFIKVKSYQNRMHLSETTFTLMPE